MRVAVICVAYLENPAGVSLLAEYFDGMDVDLFVHVDARVSIAPYADIPKAHKNVILLAERQPIFWAGFNLVRAIVGGIEAASAHRSDYGRFFILSEDTIPLRSRAEMGARMAGPEEFFSGRVEPGARERYDRFYYPDSPATSIRGLDMELRAFASDDMDDLRRLVALQARGKAPLTRLLHGSSWWGLSTPHIERFLASYHGNPWLRESFEFSLVPEEQYFHTVIGDVPNSTCNAVFVDFSRDPRPFLYRTVDEIIGARTGRHLFLRKVPLGDPTIAEFVRFLA